MTGWIGRARVPVAVATAILGLASLAGGGTVGRFEDAGDLLSALEAADQGIDTLQADVQLVRDFGPLEPGQSQKRRGTLQFKVIKRRAEAGAPGRRGFRVDFTELRLPTAGGDGEAIRDERKTYIFDGRIFAELDHETEFMHRREVAPPGENVDPLRIGEGPFPVPIGQKKDDILRRFEVELLEPGAGIDSLPPLLEDAYQLRLVPRKDSEEARDFREIRIWYFDYEGGGEALLLPRMARTINTDDSTSDVQLVNFRVNEPMADALFNTDPIEGWEVQDDEFRGEVEVAGPPVGTDSEGG